MRKFRTIGLLLAVVLFLVPSTWAGGIDNKTNWSAEYLRTWNRNASTDSADIVAYNPAGVTKMDNGLYGNLSLQYAGKDYTNTIDGDELDQSEPSYIPSLFGVYKQERWAAMIAFSNYGGGGSVDYGDGSWTTQQAGLGIIGAANSQLDLAAPLLPFPPSFFYYADITDQNVEGESMYLGYSFGGAYKINDIFSVALGARYITANRDFKGSVTVSAENSTAGTVAGVNDDLTEDFDFKQDASGWGGILGVNISPTKQLNIGIRYETETTLDFETSVDEDTLGLLPELGFEDGESTNRNLPAIFACGVSYQFTDKIRVETNLTYYLNENADWEGAEDDVDNGYDLGIGLMYAFSETLEISGGFLYTETGIDPEHMLPEAPELDARTIGGGVAWTPVDNLILNFALGNAFYEKDSFTDDATDTKVEYEKNNLFIGFGLQYKFM
jgi:long-chain fatty acid transport protein